MIRVFPRKTSKTPQDDKVYLTGPPDEPLEDRTVYVSCLFTYDREEAKKLADQWDSGGYNVSLGGPAFDAKGGNFVSGRFVKYGCVITSRGCNNKCWFCYVWKREGRVIELPIQRGWDILDDNLLQCSRPHIEAVFDMLKTQPEKPLFTGGLEAKLLREWHVAKLKEIKAFRIYFAYDTPDDYEPLVEASKLMFNGGFKWHDRKCLCYCLIGYPGDTFEKAEKRLYQIMRVGFTPFAMLYQNATGHVDTEWRRLQRVWVRPMAIYARGWRDRIPAE